MSKRNKNSATDIDNDDDNEADNEETPKEPKDTADHLDDFWQSSSLQGLPKVFTETLRFWKFFWFVLFLLLVAGCVYQMWSIFGNYYAYETTNSISIGYKHLPLRSITICNVNPVRHSTLKNHPDSDIREEYEHMCNGEKSEYLDVDVYPSKYAQEFNLLTFLDRIDTDVQLDMGHQLNPMVQSCNMHEDNCYDKNFTRNLSPEFGTCYTLNSADEEDRTGPYMVTKSGVFHGGVDLILFAEEKEYLRGFNFAQGFRLDIHPYNSLCMIEQHPIAIGTGAETFIKIKMVNITRLEPPYGQCSQEYADSFKKLYGYEYNIESCNATCKEYKIATECGCMYKNSMKFYPKDQQDLMSCHDTMDYCPLEISNFGAGCTCPLPCNEIKYNMQISSSPWGSENSYDEMVGELCRLEVNSSSPDSNCAWMRSAESWQRQDRLRNNFAKVRIYFDELLFDVIEENPIYDWSQFMADFGGNMGLWIGASIFTILELVELFTKIIVSFIQRNNEGCCKCAQNSKLKNTRKKKKNTTDGTVNIPLKETEAMA